MATNRPDQALAASLHLHIDVREGRRGLCCLTTPAPTDKGRDAPKHSKQPISQQARQRWLKDNRQYAPWHYEDHNMISTSDSKRLLTCSEKEMVHHLPKDYTKATDKPDRTRNRMLANGWHVGVAKAMLTLALLSLQYPVSNAETIITDIPRELHPDGPTWISRVCTWYQSSNLRAGPPSRKEPQRAIQLTGCPNTHMLLATSAIHPSAWLPEIDPCLHFSLSMLS